MTKAKSWVWILDAENNRVVRCEVWEHETSEEVVEQYCETEQVHLSNVQWMETEEKEFYVGTFPEDDTE